MFIYIHSVLGSRKDTNPSYPMYVLDKLTMCRDICRERGVDKIIYLGDLFNSPSLSLGTYLGTCWNHLLGLDIDQYTITGNHEIPYYNEKSFDGTVLDITYKTGIVKHLEKLELDNDVVIHGLDFGKPFEEIQKDGKYHVCVAHAFYENDFYGKGVDNLKAVDAAKLGYDAYVLGHDHTPYAPVVENNYKVIRPGSLTRGTSKTCNLYRKVNVIIFDTLFKTFEEVEVPVKPGVEVFKERRFIEKQQEDINLDKIIHNLYAPEKNSIYKIIKADIEPAKLSMKDKYDGVISLITKYLESHGIYDMEVKE